MRKTLTAVLSAAAAACCCTVMSLSGIVAFADTETYASDNLTIGDVDANSFIDTMDAASILTEAALLGTTSSGTFTEDQMYCADVNGDNQADAVDAALILNYSSYIGSGGTDDLPTYLESLGQSGAEEETPVEPEVPKDPTGLTGNIVSLTDSEVTMLAALVTLEAGSEVYECQKAVASLVINRMLTGKSTLSDVIYAKNQFSTAGRVASTTPKSSCVQAVEEVLATGTTLPIYVTFFRASYYHSWGDQVAYCCLGNTYFSYSQALKNQYVS